ncbi:alpha-(1,3)-fucosyltransferase C-like [Leguminivora glycinivorella]|uniref:alpha-(1,3)-fucosyltransferase C-like n=1 Tax=Leguminivora glycinivorella TaxID=1035111 RepID=UPI00200BEACC|nr:alpha-(1,3)-fucosyltransferase C-like [Leguminivora glycinivorella]
MYPMSKFVPYPDILTNFKIVSLMYATTVVTALLLCAYLYSPYAAQTRENTKYILLWTPATSFPLHYLRHGFDAFKSNDCQYKNCYVSHDANDLKHLDQFHAIVFNGKDIPVMKPTSYRWPWHRSPSQKYVYANVESPQNYPMCDTHFNNFFNWTWTYKLDSDLRWGYFTVHDLMGHIVGPNKDMDWQESGPIDNHTKTRLSSKSVAAAWFISNCKSRSLRENFVSDLGRELDLNDLSLDVYGSCGTYTCDRGNPEKCGKMLEIKYYFYFAFENSIYPEYVTEKVLTALNHYTVPVVFGGANYSWYLPPGSYLNARELGAPRLAARMADIIDNHKNGNGSMYHDFFRWRNHYRFKATIATESVCSMCKLLNDPAAIMENTVYSNLPEWWLGHGMTCTKLCGAE